MSTSSVCQTRRLWATPSFSNERHGAFLRSRRAPDFRRLDRVSFDRFGSKDGLSSDGVHVAFKEREGNIWFGTNRRVDCFHENGDTFYD